MNKLDYSRMKDAAAIQFMVLDMLGNIMTFSESPAKMGVYLTQEIRQLVGARIVMLIQYTGWETCPDHRVIAIEPERYRDSARLAGLGGLMPILRELQEGVVWSPGQVPEAALAALRETGCESLVAIPLAMAGEPVGVLLALDLLEMERHEDVLRSLEILGAFVGMVIRNAFYYENLESEVEARTRELADSEKHLRNLTEVAPVGIFQLDQGGRLVFVNEQWRHITGIHWLDGLPEAFHQLIHPEDRAGAARLWEAAHASHGVFHGEYRLLRADGSVVWVIGKAVFEFDDAGQLSGVIGTLTNITERKAAEESLRESNYRFNLATDSAQLAVWNWNLATGAMLWDDQMFRLYGATREEVLGSVQDWKDGLHPEDLERAVAECEAAVRGEAPFNTEFRVIQRDGTVLWVKADATVIRDTAGHPLRMIGLNRDVTAAHLAEVEKAKLQAQLEQSQKMESLGSLAGGVAHDMNNVLGAILGMASANLELQPPGSPTRRAFETIVQAASRGGKMVKSLLSFARKSPVELQEVDMNAILQEEVSLLERTTLASVRLELALAPQLWPIKGDPTALTHALMNLCVNAVDAMPASGTLTLRTGNVDADWIEVAVEDTGAGMPQEVLEKALDPFFTTKEVGKGTGLGLPMVYSTVKAHGGHLELQSRVGQGTRVLLRFPAHVLPAPPAELPSGGRYESISRILEVLVVDDDELIQSSALAILEVLGHRALGVTSGEEALARLEAGLRPDVVLLDLNMPGLGGAGTLPRLRALAAEVPVLITTGRVDQFAMDLVRSFPGVSLLPKPYTIGELKDCLAPLCLG